MAIGKEITFKVGFDCSGLVPTVARIVSCKFANIRSDPSSSTTTYRALYINRNVCLCSKLCCCYVLHKTIRKCEEECSFCFCHEAETGTKNETLAAAIDVGKADCIIAIAITLMLLLSLLLDLLLMVAVLLLLAIFCQPAKSPQCELCTSRQNMQHGALAQIWLFEFTTLQPKQKFYVNHAKQLQDQQQQQTI